MTFDSDGIWRSSGLLIRCEQIDDRGYGSRLLRFEDLNPEIKTQNVVTRWQVFRMGVWLIWKSIVAARAAE